MQYLSILIIDDVFGLIVERYKAHVSINSPVIRLYEVKGFCPVSIRIYIKFFYLPL